MAELLQVMPKFLFILMLCSAHAAAQAVSGAVLNAATSTGIAGVKVELKQTGTTVYSTTTNELGNFVVEDLKDGAYIVYYSLPGYFALPYPQPLRKPFQLTAGGPPVKLEARMIQAAKVTVHVIDGKGDPVPNAQLELIGSKSGFRGNADSKGEFQQDLFPDSFLLSVVPPLPLKPPKTEPHGDEVVNWARTYYPRTAAREAASRIVLRPGQATEIELKLLAVPAHAIRGVLLMPDGTPVPHATITLGESAMAFALPAFLTESKTDGTFEFVAVVDGPWRFAAYATDSDGDPLRLTDWVEMVGHDIEGLKLRLEPPFTVRGKIELETSDRVTAPAFPPIALRSRRRNAPQNEIGILSPPVAFPDASGSFALKSVYPGSYSIDVTDPPSPYYLDAVRVDGVEVSPRQVEFYGPVSLALVFKTNGGTLHGKCGSGWVVLIPRDAALQLPPFERAARCDSSDNYEIRAVRPGDYYALELAEFASLDSGPLALWVSAGKLSERVLNQASKVTVRPGESTAADVRAIAEQPY